MSDMTTPGVRLTTVPFRARDGFELNVLHAEGDKPPTKGPVLLVHGAGVRANLFLAPVEKNFVQYLLENGYDVWLENWRASIDFAPNEWNLDKAAANDHPEAVKTVVEQTGAKEIKAVIHCQGSTSFMMSALAGLVPQVTTIVTNAVSLHPVVPLWSFGKMGMTLPLLHVMTDYLNPHWGVEAPTIAAKLVTLLVNLTHHECNNAVCKQVSFTYGAGFPALWRHEQIDEGTHEWIKEEFGAVPLTFFDQINACVKHGNLISLGDEPSLPKDFAAQPPQTDARFSFFEGTLNRCFLPISQQKSFDWFDKQRPNYHTLHMLEGYSHLDPFIGKNAIRDSYPLMLAELDQ